MTRLVRAWGALAPEQRIAAVAALALLVTMFFPWYDLQSLDRKTGAIDSHSISAFGDVSFVEAAVFLVAAGVIALIFARAERRDFHMPGSDGAVVMLAGGWAALLIFYRVFSRPAGHGYPVGIEWGFFLAFVAAGALTWAGWRMRATSTPEAPLMRGHGGKRRGPSGREGSGPSDQEVTVVTPTPRRAPRARPVAARPVAARPSQPSPGENPPFPGESPPLEHPVDASEDITSVMADRARTPTRTTPSPPSRQPFSASKRPRFPPSSSDQLSFEDPPPTERPPGSTRER
jgi:hypothetical protein